MAEEGGGSSVWSPTLLPAPFRTWSECGSGQRAAGAEGGCSRRLTEDGGGAEESWWFLALCTQEFAAQVAGFLPAVAGGALPRSVSAWPGGAALAERDFGVTVVCSGCYSHHWGPSGRYLCHTHASPKPGLII